jgi:Domain of unknown function (DUF5666)
MRKQFQWMAAIAVAAVTTACGGQAPTSPSANPVADSASPGTPSAAQIAAACGMSVQDGVVTITVPGAPPPGTPAPGTPGTQTGVGQGPSLTPGPGPGAHASLGGAVSTVAGTCPSLTLTFGGATVRTDSSTSFAGVACSAIKANDRIAVLGITQERGVIAAGCVTGM